ncbi:MAG TPA: TolC family protein [Planctomycetota bacterium]
MRSVWTRVGVLGLAAGCATVDPRPEQAEARAAIRAATGVADVHDPEAPPDAETLAGWLADGLTLDEALRIALLENRRLQAGFARLGVSKAELVQAGLWRDPRVSFAVLLPSGGGAVRWTLDLAASVLDLWELPRREALARAELARDVLALADAASALAAEVRAAYFTAAAAGERVALAQEEERLARAELAAVEARVTGGVASALDAERVRARLAEAAQVRLAAERDAVGAREALAALFSWPRALGAVQLVDGLPARAGLLAPEEELVAQSRAQRLDLQASARDLDARRAELALQESRKVPELDLTLAAERPELGEDPGFLAGPGLTVGLPLSGAPRVRSAAAAFELAAREAEHAALVAEASQAVRAAAQRARLADEAARQAEDELVPRALELLARTRAERELGRATLLEELVAERALAVARRTELEARLAAALARAELERALGAPRARP